MTVMVEWFIITYFQKVDSYLDKIILIFENKW